MPDQSQSVEKMNYFDVVPSGAVPPRFSSGKLTVVNANRAIESCVVVVTRACWTAESSLVPASYGRT